MPGSERFPTIALNEMSDAQRALAERIMTFTPAGISGPFPMLLRSPELADRFLTLSDYLRYKTTVPERLAELAILIHARLWPDQYEWFMHVKRARQAGLTESIIEDLRHGRYPSAMGEDEAIIYAYCVELEQTRQVHEDIFARACALLGEAGLVDLTMILGLYPMLSMVLAVSRVVVSDPNFDPIAPLPGGLPLRPGA